jgi:hypothetical protein
MYQSKKGDKCGASFVDRNFRRWLERKLGAVDFRSLVGDLPENEIGSHTVVEPRMQKLMRDFETIKQRFNGISDPEESYISSLPRPLNQTHDPNRGLYDGELRITG